MTDWRPYVVVKLTGKRTGIRLGVRRPRADRIPDEYRFVEIRWF